MKIESKKKVPFATRLDPAALQVLKALAEAYDTTQVHVLEELLLQYGRRALKRKVKNEQS